MVKKPFALALFALFLLPVLHSRADDYPTRPVKVVVPYSAGGPADLVARILAPRLAKQLGQPVIVDNKAGAAGAVGGDAVAKAAPDGYTLLLTVAATLTISPHISKSLPYDPIIDFTPISTIADYANVLVVNPQIPVKSVAEFISYAKNNPGKVALSSAGVGSSSHLAGELLKGATGAPILHVPYKGNAPAMTAVIGGEVTFMFDAIVTAINYIRSGKVRALAVTSVSRNKMLPNLPTMIESGIPGFDVVGWYGLLGPAHLSKPITARLNQALQRVVSDAAVEEQFRFQGLDIKLSSPEDFAARIKAEYDLWDKVVREARIEKN